MEDDNPLNSSEDEELHMEEKPDTEIKSKKHILWPTLTGIFALLFVVSIFTQGFHIGAGGVQSVTGATTLGSTAIILNDERCADCKEQVTGLADRLKELFPGLVVNEIDYSSKEGKKIYEGSSLKYLPAVLFTKDVQTADSYSRISSYVTPAGEFLSVNIGADFDPNAEICDNKIDDDGDKLVDCEDDYCSEKLVCREDVPKKLDLFVMSQCPYGTMALDAMKEVIENFKEDINFDVHYIAAEDNEGAFSSLHGQPEVDEDIRELCAKKYYGVDYKYMDYIWCRNENIQDSNWQNCAFKSGLAVDKIKACSEGAEGKQLLSADLKLAQELGIGASPTWLANNRYQFNGVNAEAIKQNFCKYNPDLQGCGATLSSEQETPSGSC